jgi:MFS family permease
MTETSSIQTPSSSIRSALENRDFRLYWAGQTISMLGDQLHNFAVVWLVLRVTADPLALGLVLALGGIAEATFSLFGGAVVDRFSPRRVMMLADLARLLLTAFLAATIFSGNLEIWMVFVYALVMGIVNGLFGPASNSILPRLLPQKDLQKGNLLSQGSAQLTGILGPILAAVWLGLSSNQTLGIVILIALDSISFLISLITLEWMQSGGERAAHEEKINISGVKQATREGISYVSNHPPLRFLFLLVAVAGFAFAGPVMVGIPYLADTRFPEGVAAYGIILSGYAAGNLLGIIFSNRLSLQNKKDIHVRLAAIFIVFGLGLAALGWISTAWLAAFDLLIMGLLNGSISILLLTGLQRNTPMEFLGRVMSIVIFANMALMPFSQAIAGALLTWNVQLLFLGAAALMIGAAIYIYLVGDRYQIGDQLL